MTKPEIQSDECLFKLLKLGGSIALCFVIFATDLPAQQAHRQQTALRISSRKVTNDMPHIHGSIYTDSKASSLRSGDFISTDNGESWENRPMTPDFGLKLPVGFRRDLVASIFDARHGRILAVLNALDLENLDPGIREPPIAQKSYYLRYRVSDDGGKTWRFDEPIIQKGDFTAKNPLPGVFIGKNSIYIGDKGSMPLITNKGKILVPAQTTIIGEKGELFNPGNGHTYTDAVVLIGSWTKDNRIAWKMSERIVGDPKRSTRGMIEPTLIELKNGHLVMVMRGSNEQKGSKSHTLPGYKWLSVSKDGGESWARPEPLTFEGGKELYSPSSMSTLFKHSSGRCFWIGNMTKDNNQGNLPRWPLVCVELDTKSFKLKDKTLLILDTQQEDDKSKGRLDISHFSVMEDRNTKEIIITYPRSYNAYKSQEWVTIRMTNEFKK
ncbi:hypothetical protein HDC92_002736 [Pedobacter sp. AK017]|uniref:sialidase family protein n=1 Tax=Pedobacter sp. AK017 TaxID=2723073 RepID=UPI00161CC5E7|nr:sialidase family protein [Pedobacter sp. AK017]MBB5439052.1 hypothetical protein [Pedobacter sp. AK017]